ncbi:peptidoglycan-binding protein [Brevundimonas sp.]|uniref:peptidoglycan-binding protein n=1 Tax=Brevundimonas sp. TaxID=1871086 RepID=UPI00391C6A94
MADALTQIETARGHLNHPAPKSRALGLLAATALTAISAVLLAGVMVLGPGIVIEDPSVIDGS